MSKPQDYFIALSHEMRSSICVQVWSKVEQKKSNQLLKGLIKICRSSLENSKTPVEFFTVLKSSMEKFTDFTDFFFVTPESMATVVTQLRFHDLLVENWDNQFAKIIGTTEGKADVTYDLPPPALVVCLKSRKRALAIENADIKTIQLAYTFVDEDTKKLEKLCDHVPLKQIEKATKAMVSSVEKLHDRAIDKVLSGNDFKAHKYENEPILVPLDDRDDDIEYIPSDEMLKIMDKIDIRPTDTPEQARKKLQANAKYIKNIEKEMERYEDYKQDRMIAMGLEASEDDYSGMMPKPGEFVAEA